MDHDPNCSSFGRFDFQVLPPRLQSTRAVTRPLRPKVIVYFEPSSGTDVVSSPACSLTSFQDVPASSLEFCERSRGLIVGNTIVAAAIASITPITFVFITTPQRVSVVGRGNRQRSEEHTSELQ